MGDEGAIRAGQRWAGSGDLGPVADWSLKLGKNRIQWSWAVPSIHWMTSISGRSLIVMEAEVRADVRLIEDRRLDQVV
jgi:hypothetical protein